MGTRCLTRVYDERGAEIICLYRQFDGYPDGHGRELADFVERKTIVNGMTGDERNIANGMGCLAAQIVAFFKQEPGNFYLYPPGEKDAWEDYEYHVKFEKTKNPLRFNSSGSAHVEAFRSTGDGLKRISIYGDDEEDEEDE
jgi:hypothetical protein